MLSGCVLTWKRVNVLKWEREVLGCDFQRVEVEAVSECDAYLER